MVAAVVGIIPYLTFVISFIYSSRYILIFYQPKIRIQVIRITFFVQVFSRTPNHRLRFLKIRKAILIRHSITLAKITETSTEVDQVVVQEVVAEAVTAAEVAAMILVNSKILIRKFFL